MDRKSKIENLNRKYLGGAVGSTAVRSESYLSPGATIGGVRNVSTYGGIGGGVTGVTGVSGVTGGVRTVGGGLTTVGGGLTTVGGGLTAVGGGRTVIGGGLTGASTLAGGVTRLSPPSTTIVRSSRVVTSPVAYTTNAPVALPRASIVSPVAGGFGQQQTYIKPASAVFSQQVRPMTVATPVTTLTPVYHQAPVTYQQAPVTYQAPVTTYSTVQQAPPQTVTTVTRDVRTEVTTPPPAVTEVSTVVSKPVVPEPEIETRRQFYPQPPVRRVGCCERCTAMCPPCCGCPWWLALLLGLLLLSALLGALGFLLKGFGGSKTIEKPIVKPVTPVEPVAPVEEPKEKPVEPKAEEPKAE